MEKSLEILEESLSPIGKGNSSSLLATITNEWKPNSYINQSVCGTSWHEYYLDDSPDLSFEVDCKKGTTSKQKNCLYEEKYTNLVNKYYSDTRKLKDKIKELSVEITNAYQENYKLQTDISSLQQEYSLNIQNIQERHQQKLIRAKNDLGSYLDCVKRKINAQVSEKYEETIKNTKNYYEEKIESLKSDHELEIIQIQENYSNYDIKTLTLEITKEIEVNFNKKIEEITQKYEEQIKKMRKEKGMLRAIDNKKSPDVAFETLNNQENPGEKISEYIKEIEDLKAVIHDQNTKISEMSAGLGSMFKKKQPLTPLQITKVVKTLE
jgi:cell fate (sporulation/competence/biofilm development) regulator YlbF (YheA/YmcA/DUF963 family)